MRAGAASALFFAHRFLSASWMAFLPAAESLRLAFGGSGLACDGGADSPRILAHRRCWASFIRRRVAAENLRRLRDVVTGPAAAWPGTFARAIHLLRQHRGLRSLDALHIGEALESGAIWFVTYDRRQGRAAAEEGLKFWPKYQV